jgi:hypothetical protein
MSETTSTHELRLMKSMNYAIDIDGNLVDIEKAIKEKEYYCIECGSQLNIRNGIIKIKHFYHLNTVECDRESYLHKIYKKVLKDCKKIYYYDYFLGKPKTLIFHTIILEHRIGDFIPDCYGVVQKDCNDYSEAEVIIEVLHTHKVDYKKLKKIENYNIFCIEIEAREFRTIEEIENYITSENYCRKVIYNPFINTSMQKIIEENEHLKQMILRLHEDILQFENDKKTPKKLYLNFNKICKNGAYFYNNRKSEICAFLDKKDSLQNSIITINFPIELENQ